MDSPYDKLLRRIYYSVSNPASFSSAKKLYDSAKIENGQISFADVKDWLSGELTYTLHKPVIRRFKRNPIVVTGINEQFQADIADLQPYFKVNDGYKYILTVIDCFSKFAWAKPLKNKTGKAVAVALDEVFAERRPDKLQTDKGKEFINADVQRILKKYNVHFFTSKNPTTKCAIVERFNRTLKSKMFKFFTSQGSRRYVDKLQSLVDSYNNSKHRSIKFRPASVRQENEKEIFKNLYKVNSERQLLNRNPPAKLRTNDTVRLQYEKNVFDKGFFPNWTDRVYKVKATEKRPVKQVYKLTDEEGGVTDRSYYPEEVQKIKDPIYRIESVLKRRKRKGVTEYYVKWLNYPSSFNSWIPSSDVVNMPNA